MSQRYQLQGRSIRWRARRKGDVLFYREPELTPGVYTMETVVYDAFSTKATVRVSTIDVPDVDPAAPAPQQPRAGARKREAVGCRSQGERVAMERASVRSRIRSSSAISSSVRSSASRSARRRRRSCRSTSSPIRRAGAGQGEATLELLSNAQRLAKAPLQLDAPDAAGRIPHVSRLPLECARAGHLRAARAPAPGRIDGVAHAAIPSGAMMRSDCCRSSRSGLPRSPRNERRDQPAISASRNQPRSRTAVGTAAADPPPRRCRRRCSSTSSCAIGRASR